MNKKYAMIGLLCAVCAFQVGAADWPLTGQVAERCVVAAEFPPTLRAQTYAQTPTAFENEFRIRNSRGEVVPYVLRNRKIMRVTHQSRWQTLQVTSVSETNGLLTVETVWPAGVPSVNAFQQVRISTPLTDFEQNVTVRADGREVARARLCDYSRFAQFRQTQFTFSNPYSKNMTFVFSKPTSEKEAATFEKMIQMRGDGKVDAQSIRRQVTERPFKVTEIAVAYETSVTHWENALSRAVSVRCSRSEDAKAKCSYFTFNAGYLPIERIDIAFDRGTYERKAHLEKWTGERWQILHSSRCLIRALDLPEAQTRQASIGWGSVQCLGLCRLVVENGDSPPLTGDLAKLLHLACPSEEIVFLAEPGESYVATFVKDGKCPVYDQAVSHYIADRRVPCTYAFGKELSEKQLDLPIANALPSWLMEHGVKIATVAAFVILLGVCFALFRGTGSSNERTKGST